jgi:hypothetical protein
LRRFTIERRNKGPPLAAFVAQDSTPRGRGRGHGHDRDGQAASRGVILQRAATAASTGWSERRPPMRPPAVRSPSRRPGVRPPRPHQSIPADAGLVLVGEARTKHDPMRLGDGARRCGRFPATCPRGGHHREERHGEGRPGARVVAGPREPSERPRPGARGAR